MGLPQGEVILSVGRLFFLPVFHRLVGQQDTDSHLDLTFQFLEQGLVLTPSLFQGLPDKRNSIQETAVSQGDNRLPAMEILHNLAVD